MTALGWVLALTSYQALTPPSLLWGLRFLLCSFKRCFQVSIAQPGLAGLILSAQGAREEKSSKEPRGGEETELTGGWVGRTLKLGDLCSGK